MTRREAEGLDPGVLAEPFDASESAGDGTPEDESAAPEEALPVATTALVSRTGRELVGAEPYTRYLAEVRRYPLLEREEERELARRYRETGDRQALFRLVTANLMMVVRVAHSFRRAAHNLLDLIQEGNLGLLQAIDRFDPELGVRLPTYAAWWVRAYMVKFLLDNVRLVRVGTTNARRKLLRNLRKEKARLEQMGYEVGPRLLADHFGVSEQDVRDVEQALHSRDVSLDQPATYEDAPRPVDRLADARQPDAEQTVVRRELQGLAQAALLEFRRDLNDRERALLDDRILADEPQTLQAIGDRFGMTREAVRQAEARLLKRLRTFLSDRLGNVGQVRVGRRRS